MQELTLISIVIPAFNAANFIGETIASVCAQTYQEFECIIAVDRGSSDNTEITVQRLIANDSRFRLVSHEHSGISTSRNKAIELAKGDWIAFLDADDVWLPEKLRWQVELIACYPNANFLYTNFFNWDGNRDLGTLFKYNENLWEGDFANRLIFRNRIGTSTVMVRRDILRQAGLFDPQIEACEDWDLWLRMAECGLWAKGTHRPLVRYRRSSNNASNHFMRTARYDILVLEKNMKITQRPELLPLYKKSLKLHRGEEEVARARILANSTPEEVPKALWQAWWHYPRKIKWLLCWAACKWPRVLGGEYTASYVYGGLRANTVDFSQGKAAHVTSGPDNTN